MCYLKPLKVVKREGRVYTLENGIKAIADPSLKTIQSNDCVLVYGNVIIKKL